MKNSLLRFVLCGLALLLTFPLHASAGGPASPVACPRYAAGGALVAPLDLYSSGGTLSVKFSYVTRVDPSGTILYCFMTPDGVQSPTLHVRPGDELLISLTNALPHSTAPSFRSMPGMTMGAQPSMEVVAAGLQNCGGMVMTASSVNMHFHGANVPPTCHQDEVIKTLVNSGETFQYDVHFPLNEPPGLYWYHPHIHGVAEAAVQGGASGAIIVEGLEKVNREVAGLPARTLIVRDQVVVGDPDGDVPAWDISLNYSPIIFPAYSAPTITMKARTTELWRVLNASADTILDLQMQYDGVAQPIKIVAIDGVPTGSQDGDSQGTTLTRNHFVMAPASRLEFMTSAPPASVKKAQLLTLAVDTGPYGDSDPVRPLLLIKSSAAASIPAMQLPAYSGGVPKMLRFTGLSKANPTVKRTLYFSEVLSDLSDPNSPTNFFITVDGATPKLFDPANPPAIITHQGAVEDWTIENRALENHEFHIHQIHFLVVGRNGVPVSNGQYRDTINIPFWSGKGRYPSRTLRMDFRGPDIGDFVYHCHILGHEDSGMMAVIRVLP